MSATERTQRRRQRLRDNVAEQQRITDTYFAGQPPLPEAEKWRLLREPRWLIE